ncbi:NAD(P)-dependent oxidoreductase [Rhodococcus sp. O3]|uniref:NAD(P)-dependent oxidoreductase n=1 Tax=Rhodococcus sp. O3 TaxID=3404919 RepID=UPI003B671CDE
MKILVIGATGGSGRAAVAELLERGHDVTVFVRDAEAVRDIADRVTVRRGDATRPEDVDAAVQGHDAVVVTLGISENPLRVRARGPARTPLDVRSRGTRNVIDAMRRHGVPRLVVQTSYGVGETQGRLPLRYSLMFKLLLGPQIADTEVQDGLVRGSGLDWTVVQPVNLTDEPADGTATATVDGEISRWHVSRREVGKVLADAAGNGTYRRTTVAVS